MIVVLALILITFGLTVAWFILRDLAEQVLAFYDQAAGE